jgi:hypothetical protein
MKVGGTECQCHVEFLYNFLRMKYLGWVNLYPLSQAVHCV